MSGKAQNEFALLAALPGQIARTHSVEMHHLISEKEYPRATDAVNKTAKLVKPALPDTVGEARLEKCKVRLIQADTLAAARHLHQNNPNDKIAVLNMANATVAGGGFLQGSRAQEEDLCLCSTLYETLNRSFYPIADEELIYSPDVLVVKMKSNDLYGKKLDPSQYFFVDVISSAAVNRPAILYGTNNSDDDEVPVAHQLYTWEEDRVLMEQKIRYILNAAVRNNVQRLVLGAFGCGVFGNPVRPVARMMKDILVGFDNSGTDQATHWAAYGLVEIIIAIYDRANGTPVWDGFMQEFKEGDRLHIDYDIPIPNNIQYTTFPPGYAEAPGTVTETETANT